MVTAALVSAFAGFIAAATSVAASMDTPVTLTVSKDIPLGISDTRLVDVSDPQLSFRLSNPGQQRLVAFQIVWEMQFADGHLTRNEQTTDHFLEPAEQIAPSSSEILEAKLPAERGNPSPLSSVAGTIIFAEFADGTRFGPDKARLLPWFRSLRRTRLAKYQQLLRAYKVGGPGALKNALATEDPSETECATRARLKLRRAASKQGIAAVVTELNRLVAMKLPD